MSTPLNEEALEQAAIGILFDDCGDTSLWESLPAEEKEMFRSQAEYAVRYYLDALPADIVNSVEELDKMPIGAIVLDVYGASGTKIDYATWVRATPSIRGGRMFHAPYLPATVLFRPEVNDA